MRANERLIHLIASKSNKTKDEVMKEMTNAVAQMSDDSDDDEIDMDMFEDEPNDQEDK